ncbi:dynamin family protein [Daldinia vernicosa]|uniref:dynamin family protein n=1 Tax=Daldinia vernicosa TaxID=114800 RepID=UPI0020073200|nr:dynamin family protein [Daldinia vernicosa]KAI0853360.1 dynamin family protein [Daldinia vernicosa]
MSESEGIQAAGLGDPALLQKIDELRRLNISPTVPLTQLVVVGDRSTGKSSFLESLTGFPFTRASKGSTSYVIEIVYRRSNTERILVSMRPAPVCGSYMGGNLGNRNAELRAFKAELLPEDRNSKKLQDLFDQAFTLHSERGRPSYKSEFARDVLQIEITGPREEHLTIIDMPGLPDIPKQYSLGEAIDMEVESMVEDYVRMPQTIILAVVSSMDDVKNWRISKIVEDVDPEWRRSIVIFTKPDLVAHHTSKNAIVDMVNQKRTFSDRIPFPRHAYQEKPLLERFIVQNQIGHASTSGPAQHDHAKCVFFNKSPWDQLDKARIGVGSVRSRLRELLLVDRTGRYLFEVKKEVAATLATKKERLELVGEPRVDTDKQRTHLIRAAVRFSEIAKHASDTRNTRNPLSSPSPYLCLASLLQETEKGFAEMLFEKGHHYEFEGEDGTTDFLSIPTYRNDLYEISFVIPNEKEYPELHRILSEPFSCPRVSKGELIDHIREIYSPSPRYELDVFGNSLLPTIFREQSEKWTPLTLAHLSNVILIIHKFIDTAMKAVFPDDGLRVELQKFLSDEFLDCYRRAIKHAEFLLHVECKGRVATTHPNFKDLLANNREERQKRMVREGGKEVSEPSTGRNRVKAKKDAIEAVLPSVEHIYGDVHDVVKTYYEIARARFLDGIHQQAITHFLLDGEQSVFQVFTPERVLSMTSEEVEKIAKESPISTQAREELEQEVENLEKALEVLDA